MSYISFYGSGETAGSMAKFQKSETAGSIAKMPKGETAGSVGHDQGIQNGSVTIPTNTLTEDTISFRGHDDKKETSITKTLLAAGIVTSATIAAVGYAHKAGWVAKLGDGKVKDCLNKVTGKCHDWCHSTKDFCVKQYEKIKEYFTKKS